MNILIDNNGPFIICPDGVAQDVTPTWCIQIAANNCAYTHWSAPRFIARHRAATPAWLDNRHLPQGA